MMRSNSFQRCLEIGNGDTTEAKFRPALLVVHVVRHGWQLEGDVLGVDEGATGSSTFFTGLIDDVRIYNRAVKP